MSTRCQIDFINKGKEEDERQRVYRHSDGYPDGVIPDLKEFLGWNKGRNTDNEYMVANFIYWSKRWYEERYFNKNGSIEKKENPKLRWHDNQSTNCSFLHTGFGVCDRDTFHGDIEYFYKVIVEIKPAAKKSMADKTVITIIAYEISRENWDDEITKKNMEEVKRDIIEY